jgi:hypothetical protein
MARVSARLRRHLLMLGNQKPLLRGYLSHHLGQVLLLPPRIHNPLFLLFLQSRRQLWTQNPPRTLQNTPPVLYPSPSHPFCPPLPLPHPPGQRRRTWPIPLTLLPAPTPSLPRPRYLPQNSRSTSVIGAWPRPSTHPNLARPSPSDLSKGRTPPLHRATPCTAARVRLGAGRHSLPVRSVASSWAAHRHRRASVLTRRGCIMRARSRPLRRRRPIGGSIVVRSSRWMPCRGSRRVWGPHFPRERPPPPLNKLGNIV